jgi:hypothetical protein
MGAIRKRGKHYAIRYYDATGKRRWETVGPNLHEAREVLARREWDRRNGKFGLTRAKITMAEFIAKWDEDYLVVRHQLGRLKPSTLVGYRVHLRMHIEPFFGKMRLDEISLPHVREFVKIMLGKQLKPATVLKGVALVKEMFKHAVQWGYTAGQFVSHCHIIEHEDNDMMRPCRIGPLSLVNRTSIAAVSRCRKRLWWSFPDSPPQWARHLP